MSDSSTPTPQSATASLSITVDRLAYVTKLFGLPEDMGKLRDPRAIALDPRGNIWIGESGEDRIVEFSSEHGYIRQFGAEGSAEGKFRESAASRPTPPATSM